MAIVTTWRITRFSSEKEAIKAAEKLIELALREGDNSGAESVHFKKLTMRERIIDMGNFENDPLDFTVSQEEWGVLIDAESPDYFQKVQDNYWFLFRLLGPDKKLNKYLEKLQNERIDEEMIEFVAEEPVKATVDKAVEDLLTIKEKKSRKK